MDGRLTVSIFLSHLSVANEGCTERRVSVSLVTTARHRPFRGAGRPRRMNREMSHSRVG